MRPYPPDHHHPFRSTGREIPRHVRWNCSQPENVGVRRKFAQESGACGITAPNPWIPIRGHSHKSFQVKGFSFLLKKIRQEHAEKLPWGPRGSATRYDPDMATSFAHLPDLDRRATGRHGELPRGRALREPAARENGALQLSDDSRSKGEPPEERKCKGRFSYGTMRNRESGSTKADR